MPGAAAARRRRAGGGAALGDAQRVAVDVENAQRRAALAQRTQEDIDLLARGDAQIAHEDFFEWGAGVAHRVGESE